MLEALNILEGYDLKAMGHNSPQYLHTVVEAVKLAFADRDRYYGDPKFSKIPKRRCSRSSMRPSAASRSIPTTLRWNRRPGTFGGPLPMPQSTADLSGIATPRASMRWTPWQCFLRNTQRCMAAVGDCR